MLEKRELPPFIKKMNKIPPEVLKETLNSYPGWTYSGPYQEITEKLGPNNYLPTKYKIIDKDFINIDNWMFLRTRPFHKTVVTIPASVNSIKEQIQKVLKMKDDRYLNYRFDDDQLVLEVTGRNEYVSEATSSTEAMLVDILIQLLGETNTHNIPCLANIPSPESMQKIEYQGKTWPCIHYKTFPRDVFLKKFNDYFVVYKRHGKVIGELKMIEGIFLVTADYGNPYTKAMEVHKRKGVRFLSDLIK